MDNVFLAEKLGEFKEFINRFIKKSLESADDIHKLRIKCRELFSLLSKDDAFAKSVKKVISLSNEIRDIDVFFDEYLESLPKKQRKKVLEQITSKAKEGGRKKEIKKLHKYLKNLEIPNSAEQKVDEEVAQNLVTMKLPEFDKKKLHKYRIYIKKRLYIEKNSSSRDEKKIKNLTDIKDTLGAINDNYNGLERLKSYGVKEKLYEKIERYTQEENAKLYEKIKADEDSCLMKQGLE
ncbi:MAG: CHAD domain-containing protein [Sulfurimonadaceae bacterium]